MTDIFRHLLPASFVAARNNRRALAAWRREKFSAPSPVAAKQAVLMRYGIPTATWVETGTYLGDTTALLAKTGHRVVTLEPAKTLFNNAQARFAGEAHVEVMNGPSETIFPTLLPKLSGDVAFWLKGGIGTNRCKLALLC
jgi:protein-L-isoaspartate O-methyltransferase